MDRKVNASTLTFPPPNLTTMPRYNDGAFTHYCVVDLIKIVTGGAVLTADSDGGLAEFDWQPQRIHQGCHALL
jgi:hypothetical protein